MGSTVNNTVEAGVQANSRVAKIKLFLSKPPKEAVLLRMFCEGDPPVLLEQWPANACVPALAATLDETMVSHAGELDRFEVQFALIYFDLNEKALASRTYRVRRPQPETIEQLDPAGTARQVFTADQGSLLIQMQRHHEAMAKLYMGGQQTSLMSLQQQNQLLTQQVLDLVKQLGDANETIRELRMAMVEQVEDAMATATGKSEDDVQTRRAQEKFVDLLEKFGPYFLMRMGGASSGGAPPAAGAAG